MVKAPAPKSTRTIKAAVLLPDPGGWPVAWQVFHPQVAGGIRKRLPTLFNIAAATYFPEFTFEFTEFIFENFNTWPTDASQYDLFLVTGAKEGAYDQHVPYVPVLEKYIGDNVNKTRFIGLSYGHQTIAWGLNPGGKNVIHNPHGWENAAVDVKVSREGMAALRTSKTSYFVNNHHGDAVLTAPPGTVHVSSSGPTPVQSFISDRVFTNEGHIEYSPGIMEMWARWDTYHGLYSLESAKHYLATRTHLPCDNKLGFLPDALWLAGKMVGWIGNSGVVPTDEELSARKAQYGDAARVLVEYYEDALLNRAYAEAVARYGGARRVAELKRLWDDYWSTGRKFSEEYFTEKN
ncbi:hypothetical protein M427DRAFT_277349 [Gonapodya prolifera JEL478]|uniref:Uncharacterized protein n=1 Tax=Gonapodya prolifera (strain JEL478) TaxID=1344416 RepID=A0A139AYD6_GONPJ|nr:hypothetical protein M427DRAFT_277349 [Gonapodya prolifera JEL478]|eukprot:KXS21724.1 hypothetical protein M427DRAFT_277349 [Gonapodya prolifera JEL478]